MKKNGLLEIKGLSVGELREKALGLKKEIADLTMDKNMKKLKDLKSLDKKRKDLAQVLTIARTKELLALIESEEITKTDESQKRRSSPA